MAFNIGKDQYSDPDFGFRKPDPAKYNKPAREASQLIRTQQRMRVGVRSLAASKPA